MAKSKTNVVKFIHSDPGHAWLAVKTRELSELGIADKISQYSYVKGKTTYLEEDADMATYVNAQKERGVTVEIRQGRVWPQKCPVRYFASYEAPVTAPTVDAVAA